MLAPPTCGAFGTAADVGVLSVLADTAVPARLAQTLIDVGLTQSAGVTGVALAAEGGQAVNAGSIVARVRGTLVDVGLTVLSGVACQNSLCLMNAAFLGLTIQNSFSSVQSRSKRSSLFTFSALARVLVWPVRAFGAIFAWCAGTLVNVNLAEVSSEA